MATDIIKQRLVGVLLALLIVSSLTFFLVNQSNYAGHDEPATDKKVSALAAHARIEKRRDADNSGTRKDSPSLSQLWLIQLGSFKLKKNALALHEKVAKMGFDASIEKYDKNYRVRIAIKTSKQELDKLVTRLAKELTLKPQVFSPEE